MTTNVSPLPPWFRIDFKILQIPFGSSVDLVPCYTANKQTPCETLCTLDPQLGPFWLF